MSTSASFCIVCSAVFTSSCRRDEHEIQEYCQRDSFKSAVLTLLRALENRDQRRQQIDKSKAMQRTAEEAASFANFQGQTSAIHDEVSQLSAEIDDLENKAVDIFNQISAKQARRVELVAQSLSVTATYNSEVESGFQISLQGSREEQARRKEEDFRTLQNFARAMVSCSS